MNSQSIPLPVLIAGGGPVGLTLAALLARYGIETLVIEADAGYCTGSRAICVSRRSQEILAWAGAAQATLAKGLPWAGGRSYWRGQEVLHFQMPNEPTQRFAPMLNIQQYYIEQYAHLAGQRDLSSELPKPRVLWSSKVVAVDNQAEGVRVVVEGPDGLRQTFEAAYLVACDGGRSTVREQLGVQLEGVQYEGKYVIVDIEQDTERPVERLAWFDPPSNPGSTLLMHRQPDKVWRVDYQVRDGEDPDEAVKPENVLPRVQSHLTMIGETAPWKPLWISIYNAKCLTLAQYRYGRTFFAGDAGHLVPIFGVRGLNSGLDDAANLAWKLALVVRGQASDRLLDTYSQERVHATRENISYGAKSTEFMAPPSHGFVLMREAVLRLASIGHAVKSLINPRQSAPIEYLGSALNIPQGLESVQKAGSHGPWLRAGLPAPEALLRVERDGVANAVHLSEFFGHCFALITFFADAPLDLAPLTPFTNARGLAQLRCLCIDRPVLGAGNGSSHGIERLIDAHGQASERYGAFSGLTVLVRPDGYLMACWPRFDPALIVAAMSLFQSTTESIHDTDASST
jgi:3-(3-hydroxy-phenyl)propionate hydroxylase